MITKKRSPLIAGLLSLLTPGIGQMYNGQMKKAVFTFVLLVASPLLFFFIELTFWIVPLFLALVALIYIGSIVDSVISAMKLKQITLSFFNKGYFYFSVFLTLLLISQFVDIKRIVGIEPYVIEGPAMQETLAYNDRVLVSTRIKKFSAGDIVVYKNEGMLYIHRIVAVPGDTVAIHNNNLIINGKQIDEPFISNIEYRKEVDELTVPQDSFYILGDNRGIASDSRNFGTVHGDRLIGKVLYVLLSDDFNRIGKKL